MTRKDALTLLKHYLDSGDCRMDFEYGSEDTKYEVLELLEEIIELGEAADALATSLIFKGNMLEMFAGIPDSAVPEFQDEMIQSQRELGEDSLPEDLLRDIAETPAASDEEAPPAGSDNGTGKGKDS